LKFLLFKLHGRPCEVGSKSGSDCFARPLFPSSSFIDLKNQTPQQYLENATEAMEERPDDNSTSDITEPAQADLESATAGDSLPQQAANTEGHVEVSGNQSINTPAENEAEGGAVVDGNLDGMAAEKDPEGAFSSW
jgi:hypothetical protein